MGKKIGKRGLGLMAFWVGTGTLVQISLNWQTVMVLVSHVNAHQRASAAEALNNEMDKITLWRCQSASFPSHCSVHSMGP